MERGFRLTNKGLQKFDATGRARKNWVHEFKNKSRRFLEKYCERCNSRDNLTIHHIKKVGGANGILRDIKSVEELRRRVLDPDNCMTLCRECHDIEHEIVKKSMVL